MKKTEIISLSVIILGIYIILKSILDIVDQIIISMRYADGFRNYLPWILISLGIILLLVAIGYLLIIKSDSIAKFITKDSGDEHKVNYKVSKSEVLHLSIIILCLYFLVMLFPALFQAIYSFFSNFIYSYQDFRQLYAEQLMSILMYIAILLILLKSEQFSKWLEHIVFRDSNKDS